MVRVNPWPSHMLGKFSTSGPYSQPQEAVVQTIVHGILLLGLTSSFTNMGKGRSQKHKEC